MERLSTHQRRFTNGTRVVCWGKPAVVVGHYLTHENILWLEFPDGHRDTIISHFVDGLNKHLDVDARKGEKGIAILAPIVVKRPTETNENGKALVGFKATYVFDVSQTDGADLPEFATVSGDPADSLEALKSFATSQGISVEYDARISPALGTSYGGLLHE